MDDRPMTCSEPPEYLPTLYFSALLCTADAVEVRMDHQYSRQSFQNRARLRTPDGWQWITVPLQGGQTGLPIGQTLIDHSDNWQARHLKAFQFNYGTSPFFEHFFPGLQSVLAQQHDTLGTLTAATVRLVHELLGAPGRLLVRHGDEPGSEEHLPRDLILAGKEKETPPAALAELKLDLPPYRQNFDGFERDMSTMDLLFNYGPAARGMLTAATEVTRI